MIRLKNMLILCCMLPLTACADADVSLLLEEFQWKNRVLVLLAEDADNAELVTLHTQIADIADAWAERDLVTLTVVRNSYVAVDDARKAHLPTAPFFEHFETQGKPFTMLLIGKDGFEKYRDEEAISAECVLAIIDAMPMRQREAKKLVTKP